MSEVPKTPFEVIKTRDYGRLARDKVPVNLQVNNWETTVGVLMGSDLLVWKSGEPDKDNDIEFYYRDRPDNHVSNVEVALRRRKYGNEGITISIYPRHNMWNSCKFDVEGASRTVRSLLSSLDEK